MLLIAAWLSSGENDNFCVCIYIESLNWPETTSFLLSIFCHQF